jgi:AcrR family transcriptional regulator
MSLTPRSKPTKVASKRPRARPTEGAPRTALTLERIESQALALIDAYGIEAFSTRKLGEQLGCEAMSIYHHYPSKAHILDALVDRVLGGMPIPDKSLSPATRLRQFADGWRQISLQHPRFYLWLSLHQWNSATGVRFMSEMLACFTAAGLSPEMSVRGFRMLGYYVQGATLDESSGYAQGHSSLSPMPQDTLERDYPQVASARKYFTPEHFDRTFDVGWDALVRALGLE